MPYTLIDDIAKFDRPSQPGTSAAGIHNHVGDTKRRTSCCDGIPETFWDQKQTFEGALVYKLGRQRLDRLPRRGRRIRPRERPAKLRDDVLCLSTRSPARRRWTSRAEPQRCRLSNPCRERRCSRNDCSSSASRIGSKMVSRRRIPPRTRNSSHATMPMSPGSRTAFETRTGSGIAQRPSRLPSDRALSGPFPERRNAAPSGFKASARRNVAGRKHRSAIGAGREGDEHFMSCRRCRTAAGSRIPECVKLMVSGDERCPRREYRCPDLRGRVRLRPRCDGECASRLMK